MLYPNVNANVPKRQRQTIQLMGINLTDNYADGQLESCKGISADRYPYIETEQKPVLTGVGIPDGHNPIAIFAWEKLFVVSDELAWDGGYKCYYDGEYCGNARNLEPKQFAVINSKLVMFPDKVYFDLYQSKVHEQPLTTAERLFTARNGSMSFSNLGFTIPCSVDDMPEWEAGMKIRLVNCILGENNGTYTVRSVAPASMDQVRIMTEEEPPVKGDANSSGIIAEIYTEDGKIVPDMDFICSKDNRLYGCNSETRTIYVSALGDPTDFETFAGDSLDAYQVAVGSAGKFTGCCALNNAVLFMKEHCIHKLLGNFPAEYTLYTYDLEGVSESNSASLVSIGPSAIYVSEHGVSTYEGSTSGTLSKELGVTGFNNAVGSYNGRYYVLAFDHGDDTEQRCFAFDLQYGIWLEKKFDGEVMQFAHVEDKDYVLVKNGSRASVYIINSGADYGLYDEWQMTFKPNIENITGSYKSSSAIFEKKRYTDLTFRLELPKGSKFKVEIMVDGVWWPAGRLEGRKDGVATYKICTPRVDKLQVRLSGKGRMALLAMERQFILGSRR